jgi:hypothetical protein
MACKGACSRTLRRAPRCSGPPKTSPCDARDPAGAVRRATPHRAAIALRFLTRMGGLGTLAGSRIGKTRFFAMVSSKSASAMYPPVDTLWDSAGDVELEGVVVVFLLGFMSSSCWGRAGRRRRPRSGSARVRGGSCQGGCQWARRKNRVIRHSRPSRTRSRFAGASRTWACAGRAAPPRTGTRPHLGTGRPRARRRRGVARRGAFGAGIAGRDEARVQRCALGKADGDAGGAEARRRVRPARVTGGLAARIALAFPTPHGGAPGHAACVPGELTATALPDLPFSRSGGSRWAACWAPERPKARPSSAARARRVTAAACRSRRSRWQPAGGSGAGDPW